MPVQSIPSPAVQHTFERRNPAPDLPGVELPVVFVGPHRQIVEAFDAASAPLATSRVGTLTPAEMLSSQITPELRDDEFPRYDVPGILPGAKVETVQLWAVTGAGTSQRVNQLRPPSGETILAAGASGLLTAQAGFDGRAFTLRDERVNFHRLLGRTSGVIYPQNDAQRASGGWLLVRVSSLAAGPFLVAAAPSPDNPHTLVLQSLGYSPFYDSAAVSYELVRAPREFDWLTGSFFPELKMGAGMTRLSTLRHVKLVQPGTVTVTTGGGHAGVILLTASAKANLTDNQTITLKNAGNTSYVLGIDVAGDGVAGSDFVANLSDGGITTAAHVAAAIVTAIRTHDQFDAFVHPLNTAVIVVRQRVTGVNGNKVCSRTAGYNWFSASVPNPADPSNTLQATFDGGSALVGTTYVIKNVSDKPAVLKLAAGSGNANAAHPGWSVSGNNYIVTGGSGFVLPANDTASVFELNALLSTEAQGGPRVFVEPASLDTWGTEDDPTVQPTRTLCQLLAPTGTAFNQIAFVTGQANGEVTVPAATVKKIILHDRLVGAFRPEHTSTLTLASGAVQEVTGSRVGAAITVTIPHDAGTVMVGRVPGTTGPSRLSQVLTAANAKLKEYYVSLGYTHAPDDILALGMAPAELDFVADTDTDLYPLAQLAGVGIESGGVSTVASIYLDNAASYQRQSPVTLTPAQPTHIATLRYRTAGVAGNNLAVGFYYDANTGLAHTLGIVSSTDDQIWIRMPSTVRGLPSATNLGALARLLSELDDAGNYVYPVRVASVVSASTGAAVAPGTNYAGWDGVGFQALGLRQEAQSLRSADAVSYTVAFFSGQSESLRHGSSAGAVVRVRDTFRGKGSTGVVPLYVDYKALRTDTSPVASLSVHNRVPDPVRVDPTAESLDAVIGPRSLSNPMRVAAEQFFTTGGGAQLYFIGVDEVSTDDPWGTEAALNRVWELLLLRKQYHVIILNDAPWVVRWAAAKARSLGGEVNLETGAVSFLQHSLLLYVPVPVPEISADLLYAEGEVLQLISAGETTTVINTDSDLLADGVVAGDVLISVDYPTAGVVELQDGRRGWRVVSVDTANPSRVTVDNPGSGAVPETIFGTQQDPEPWEIIRPGSSLYNASTGAYEPSRALASLEAVHTMTAHHHRRLIKHMGGTYRDKLGASYVTLSHVYLLAQYGGIIARLRPEIPTSGSAYNSSMQSYVGPSSFFSNAQLAQLTGMGLTCASQEVPGTGPVIVYRDVSSVVASPDPNQRSLTFRRRGSQVVEDLLVRRVNLVIQPMLRGAVMTTEFLDMVSANVDRAGEYFTSTRLVKAFEVVSIQTINDAIREEYGINDTGLLIIWSYVHQEEVGAVLFRHVVENR